MKVNYDREEDILMIEVAPKECIDHAEQQGPFIAHFSEEGKLVLLEILDASDLLSSLVKVTARGGQEKLTIAEG